MKKIIDEWYKVMHTILDDMNANAHDNNLSSGSMHKWGMISDHENNLNLNAKLA